MPGAEIAVAVATVLFSLWINLTTGARYPIVPLSLVLLVGTAVIWLTMRTLTTTLSWVEQAQRRTDRLLAETRSHRSQVSHALQSAEIANSRLRRVERELTIAQRDAEEARRMKEQFAANVSHELRTPLNLILGFSEMMYLSPEVYGAVNWTPALRRDTYQIYKNGRHLLDMIDDILALSQFEIASFALNKEATDVGPLLQSAVDIARDLFRTSSVALELDIAPLLPPMELDQTRIRQVLLNLLNNALRFTAEGTVTVNASATESEVVVQVIDTGPGIPAEHQEHIFNEFYQMDLSLRRSHTGVGLGLAICRQFVQAHNGRIWVESEPGKGSTFVFTLPIPERYIPLGHLSRVRSAHADETKMTSTLFVVDPDPAVAAIVRHFVRGYEIQHVARLADLVSLVHLHHPRAVIYNQAHQQDLHKLRLPAGLPLIECALPSRAWIIDELGIDGCLSKPLTAEQLLQEIVRLEDRRTQQIRSVLVVDDDRGFCQLITRYLESSGRAIEIRRAYDGEEALRILENEPPDLLLLDLVMPGKDGYAVLDEVRRGQNATLPVLLLTATDVRESLGAYRDAAIVAQRIGGMRPGESLRWIASMLDAVEPLYQRSGA
jgi:signal transduction histidine kinase/CheY-like chemotaxis protein